MRLRPAEALGDVLAGQLDVDAAGPGADRAVGLEEPGHLVDDVLEMPGLATGRRRERVAVHRVAGPHDRVAWLRHGTEQRRQDVADPLAAHAGDQA